MQLDLISYILQNPQNFEEEKKNFKTTFENQIKLMIEFQMYTLLMSKLNSINISKGSGKKYCLPVAGSTLHWVGPRLLCYAASCTRGLLHCHWETEASHVMLWGSSNSNTEQFFKMHFWTLYSTLKNFTDSLAFYATEVYLSLL